MCLVGTIFRLLWCRLVSMVTQIWMIVCTIIVNMYHTRFKITFEMLLVSNKLTNNTFHASCNLMTSYGCHSNGNCSTVLPLCRFGFHQSTVKISWWLVKTCKSYDHMNWKIGFKNSASVPHYKWTSNTIIWYLSSKI